MKFTYRYTGIRVRDLDAAIRFFTRVLGMKLKGRIRASWHKGEFANLVSEEGGHKLEISWYADDSPVAGPFHEGDELDHLGFRVDDFDAALARLKDAGYVPRIGPIRAGRWHFAFVPVIEGLWLDVFHVDEKPKPKRRAGPKRVAKKRRR